MTDEGLIPYLFNEQNLSNLDNLLETDYLFINFPHLNLIIIYLF